jgi:hypothetical protein
MPAGGEAVVTALDPRGVPTPVVAARLIPPASRMAPLTSDELQADIRQSDLLAEYGTAVDRDSAREMLAARLGSVGQSSPPTRSPAGPAGTAGPTPTRESRGMSTGAKIGSAIVAALGTTVARSVGRALVRGVLGGLLGGKAARGTRRTRW